jgi:hypothetical protein
MVFRQTLDFSAQQAAWPKAAIYGCATCGAHISMTCYVISKKFQGRSGRAYMMRKIVNCYLGPREDRVLVTGLHTVADVHCRWSVRFVSVCGCVDAASICVAMSAR